MNTDPYAEAAAKLARVPSAPKRAAPAAAPPADPIDDFDFGPGYTPFPVDALPGPAAAYVASAAESLSCDPSYIAVPLLVSLGAAVGYTRVLALGPDWHAVPVLWGAVVGESGTMKTPAGNVALRFAEERQAELFAEYERDLQRFKDDLARHAEEKAAWKAGGADGEPPTKPDPPKAGRAMVADTTFEGLVPVLADNPRGMLLVRDELGGWLGGFDRYAGKGGADSGNWLSTHNAGPITVDRKTGEPRVLFVPRAAVWITGGIQPGVMRRLFGREHRESGLLARFLLAAPPRRPKVRSKARIDPIATATMRSVFASLYGVPATFDRGTTPAPHVVELSPEADAAFDDYYRRHNRELLNYTGDAAAGMSKLEEAAGRLALVHHCALLAAAGRPPNDPTPLPVSSMTAGIRLAEWFKAEMLRVYAMLEESDAEADDRKLVDWLRRRGGRATVRDVQQKCRWLKAPGAAREALNRLAEERYGDWDPPDTNGRGAGETFRLFPPAAGA